ncbi:hypothetical protein M441DRAFT_438693 [Trichoderma asperellum CBS 433.97]|uniref:Uncharacterized protein n=1 Tax=Trichoderma asperellum (strain ATCC 204424 / CBS 433.97 / NBRC 101777) TaxID=1042311 RepID=A0A2T3Z3V4_TRIA4|nr:hypothetical protein M441DRAFT_438693 [Trichoderma asperellum CBS 433.97]PTB39483.1 hypothetical protein M441DRAFT_438693 [Trichoderma asperellum CBS 433.97]
MRLRTGEAIRMRHEVMARQRRRGEMAYGSTSILAQFIERANLNGARAKHHALEGCFPGFSLYPVHLQFWLVLLFPACSCPGPHMVADCSRDNRPRRGASV